MAERDWYEANRAVRSYCGPIKLPDGRTHPEWARLLRAAEIARTLPDRSRPCPTCGRRFYRQ